MALRSRYEVLAVAFAVAAAPALAGCLAAPEPLDPASDGPATDIDAPPADARIDDAPVPDGAIVDARPPDAAHDAPPGSDALVVDAAPVDALAPDARPPDAAPPDAAPVDAPPALAQYNFETSDHGFTAQSGATTSRVTDRAWGGTSHSLRVALSTPSAYSVMVGTGSAPLPQAGDVVTFHFWVSADAHVTSLQPYVQASDSGYPWISQEWVVPSPLGSWITVSLPAVPSGYTTWRVGVQINVDQASTGVVYLDEIGW